MVRDAGLLVMAIVLVGSALFLLQLSIISIPVSLILAGSGAALASFSRTRRLYRLGFRLIAGICLISGIVFGGWLDLSFWDLGRAKPSSYYLGPPKIP